MELKPMKLIFLNNVDTWDKIITDLRGNIILEQKGLKFFPEMNNNIVEVERFI
jgi:hypothetical protein